MSVLLAKVTLLMLAASLLGGLLAWWLVRRDFKALAAEQARHEGDWALWRRQLDRRLVERTAPDLTPLLHRFGAIEKAIGSIRLPTPEPTNLRPVLDAVASIRLPEGLKANLDPLHARLLALEGAINGIAATAALPPAGDGPSAITGLGGRLDAIEARLAELRSPASVAAPNLQPLMASLLELQRAVAAIRIPPATTVDLAPVLQRLTLLQAAAEAAAPRPGAPGG